MPSFKGFLRNGKPTATDFSQSLHGVLTGISRYTIDGREDDLAQFRENMLNLASRIHEQTSAVEVETTVGQALDLFREYNERALKFTRTHTAELKAVMRSMTETITYLSESRTRSVHQLQFMERELEQASQIDDLRLLRARLITCLEVVRDETLRLQTEAQTRSQQVRQQLDRAATIAEPPSRFGTMDTVTGLPARPAAERAITEALGQDSSHAVAVFVVNRLASINSKFGRAVGDEVMLRVANHFAQNLSSAASLYRWSGPALVALIATQRNPEDVRRSWAKAASAKQEINLESKQRTVFVVVDTTMHFQFVAAAHPPEELFHCLDHFVAAQSDGTPEEVLQRH